MIHDWLTGMRGGEKVLEAILELYPTCELFTLFHFPGTVSGAIESHRIHVSFLQGLASSVDDYRRLLPLFPLAVRGWDLSAFDLVISSSHCVAHGVNAAGSPHVSYCHTPMRYIWDRFDDYFPPRRPLLRFAGNVIAPALRRWDVAAAQEVDVFVANSRFVAGRIERAYDRQAEVIHPFVDELFLKEPLERRDSGYHLIVSALVPYKRLELAIDASNKAGFNLKIVGTGPMEKALRSRAGPNVEFTGFVSTTALVRLLQDARSLILPGVEDFGITCLEAMASGTPVVAFGAGGALDSVIDGETGILFNESTVESLVAGIETSESTSWDSQRIRNHAGVFTRQRFMKELSAVTSQLAGTK